MFNVGVASPPRIVGIGYRLPAFGASHAFEEDVESETCFSAP